MFDRNMTDEEIMMTLDKFTQELSPKIGPELARLRAVESLMACFREWLSEVTREGLNRGQVEGITIGMIGGYNDSLAVGQKEGMTMGMIEGYNEGYSEGYHEGACR